jgi:ribosomal protein S18 acetylase RimI-like enzyme
MGDASPRLRPARAPDAPRLARIARAAYARWVERLGGREPRPMSEDYDAVLAAKQVLVAERDGELVGLVVLDVDAEGFLVDNVAVDPAHEGTGVGRALLSAAEAAAARAGFDAIHLCTHERMTENVALYERIGYVEYDRRAHGRDRDLLVYLRKPLAPAG